MQDLKRPDLIRVATCFSAADSQFLVSYMGAHGVHVEKTNDYFIHAAPVYALATGGVELWIRGHDAALAADLIEKWQADEPQERSPRTTRWVMVLVFYAFIIGWPPPSHLSFMISPSLVRQLGAIEDTT